ncbi:MAG: hypothetical protein JEZ09_20995 [Salinivirgaceae bacterium]|nr:hypothetical protein [Salinivirgaceae bacterium]
MKVKNSFLFILLLFSITSCMVTKEQFGNYESIDGKPKTLLVDQEINLFWDMVPLQKIKQIDNLTDYEITKRRGFFGTVTYYGSMGIYSSYIVTIKTKQTTKKDTRER